MPQYYFDVFLGDSFFPDEGGTELESFGAAKLEAASVALGLAHHHLLSDDNRDVMVKVKNDDREQMLVMALSMNEAQLDRSRNALSPSITILCPKSGERVRI